VTGQQPRDALLDVLHGPLSTRGLDLEGVEISTAGRKRLVRVLVDKDGGVTMDEIADATKEVSRLLDETDVMGEQPYLLEVSSPGTDRPLTHPRHWRRNQSRLVKVTTTDGTTYTGRVRNSDEHSATLDVDGTERVLPYGEVAKARIQIEFNRKES